MVYRGAWHLIGDLTLFIVSDVWYFLSVQFAAVRARVCVMVCVRACVCVQISVAK